MITTRILIEDRDYTSWEIVNCNDNTLTNPLKYKLFHDDLITIDKNKTQLVHSPVKTTMDHPGVLVLDVMKTYGKKKDKFLYKCIPDDKHLPIFLVPYKVNGNHTNKYVTFKFDRWCSKHPEGIITNNLGDIDKLSSFYEYQLYCKSLNASIQKFTNVATQILKKTTEEEIVNKILKENSAIENYIDSRKVFSIDPPGSADYDDAFSIDTINDTTRISIYIANVSVWMESLNLWDSFSNRIATIYLPDRRRPMLPTRLSDFLCSLQENQKRFALVCEVIVKNNEILDVTFKNAVIKVYKNYRYEEDELLKDNNYLKLLKAVKPISKKYKYASITVKNSHEVVSYLMIMMNYHCAKKMIENKNGIYRSAFIKNDNLIKEDLPEDVTKQITLWNAASGQYQHYGDTLKHELMDLESYIHITSPIRRLVDLLNLIQFQKNLKLVNFGARSDSFYNFWYDKIDYINTTMRSIRKVQTDCNLLNVCINNNKHLNEIYDGYMFDRIRRMDGLYQYVVFLEKLKMFSRVITTNKIDNFTSSKFKLFVFHDEDCFKRKIRLQKV